MPYVTQSRRSNQRETHYHITGPSGVNETADPPSVWDDRETVFTYRSQGVDDQGNSNRYEDLPGDVLRAEAMGQSWARSTGDNGHEFWKTTLFSRRYAEENYVAERPGTPANYQYRGYITPTTGSTDYTVTVPAAPGANALNVLGSKAVSRFMPEPPTFSLLRSLAELYREGLPALVGSRTFYRNARNEQILLKTPDVGAIGEEHLNFSFGYKPLASDIATLANLTLSFQNLWKEFKVLSDAQVRRRGVLQESTSSTYGTFTSRTLGMGRRAPGGTGAVESPFFFFPASTGPVTWRDEDHVKIWFSGAWVFHLEPWEKFFQESAVGKTQRLLGLELTPEVIYDLTPWSWLFDWWGNVGNMLHTISNQLKDSQVMRYGYLMHQTTRTRVLTRSPTSDYTGRTVGPFVATVSAVRKDRVRATPYGFGVDTASLSNSQWGILGALGLTKAPKTLRRFD